MSDTYWNSVRVSHTNYDPYLVNPGKGYGNQTWYPRDVVQWTQELQNSLIAFFNRCNYPFRYITEIPFKEPLRSEIRRFFLSLDAYKDSPNPVIPIRDILYGSTDKGYAEVLKRIRRKSFLTSWNAHLFEYPDWWNEVPQYRIKDIGDIFNYSYLIFWKTEEPNDYLNGLIDVKINPDRLTKFKNILSGLLPKRSSFQKIEKSEILCQISGSQSYNADSKEKSLHYKLKPKHLKFSKQRKEGIRSVIYVSPDNIRDSVINDIEDLNTISLLDQQIMEILRVMPGHIHLRDKDRVTSRLFGLYNKYTYFLQRDIFKEGITKPKEIVKAILEVLKEEYPDIEVFGYTSFYDNYILRVGDKAINMKRGHGLGMANTITTLMNLVIHELIVDELLNDIPTFEAGVLTLNDDFVAGFPSEEFAEEYWDKEDEIMDELSILREPKKSFMTFCKMVIAERYIVSGVEWEKTSYQLRELLIPLACANVTHAKEMYIAIQGYVDHKLGNFYKDEIMSYWGYEFFPDEFNYPSKVGGWINPSIYGVDLTFLMLESLTYNTLVCRGEAATHKRVQPRRRGNFYQSPRQLVFGFPYIPQEYKEILDITHMSIVDSKYGGRLSYSRSQYKRYWERLRKEREAEFKIQFQIPFEELQKKIFKSYPTTQFYLSDSMIYRYHPTNKIRMNIDDIYIDSNPITALIAKYNPIQYDFKEEFSIMFSERDNFNKRLIGSFSREVERTLKNESISSFWTSEFIEVEVPSDGYKPEMDYLNPVRVGMVNSHFNWGMGYPEPKPDFRYPNINKKKEVYNRLFSIEEQCRLSRLGFNRPCIKVIANYLNSHPQQDFEDLIDYLIREIKKIIPPPKDIYEEIPEEEPIEPEPPDIPAAQGRIKVTLNSLLADPEGIYWDRNYNPEKYIVTDKRVSTFLLEIKNLELSLGRMWDTGNPNRDRVLEEIKENRYLFENLLWNREIISQENERLFGYIAERSGILKLASDQLLDDALEEGLGLFGD